MEGAWSRKGGAFVLLTPLILLSGGVALLVLNYFFPGDVLGYGFPNFLAMVHPSGARLKRRWILLKAVGAAISLGAGASVGREGPIAQIGGSIGSAVAQALQSVLSELRFWSLAVPGRESRLPLTRRSEDCCSRRKSFYLAKPSSGTCV